MLNIAALKRKRKAEAEAAALNSSVNNSNNNLIKNAYCDAVDLDSSDMDVCSPRVDNKCNNGFLLNTGLTRLNSNTNSINNNECYQQPSPREPSTFQSSEPITFRSYNQHQFNVNHPGTPGSVDSIPNSYNSYPCSIATSISNNTHTAAQIRIQRDIQDLDDTSLPNTLKVSFPNPNDLFYFLVTLIPDEGLYKKGIFQFSFKIPGDYPHEPPKSKCLNKIYHPNIDLEGNVCLNILREDWKPVLSLVSVLMGLQHLFLEPNAEDPLNKDAAAVLKQNPSLFRKNVLASMEGRAVDGVRYDKVV